MPRPREVALAPQVAALRHFTRFYTRVVGVLEDGYLRTPFSVAEARVLYELAHRDEVSASDLVKDLKLDPGYLSRLLQMFARRGLVRRTRSTVDGRRAILSLTPKGRITFAPLDSRADELAADLLAPLAPRDRAGVVQAMTRIERLLSAGARPAPAPPARRAGDRSR